MGVLYLLHFDRPISDKHTCQNYVGFTARSLEERLAEHAAGRGARLTQVAVERGIGWRVAATWKGTRKDERRFKNRKNAPHYCPFCNGEAERKWKEEGVIISHKGKQHSIGSLPKWAQETIKDLLKQRDEMHKTIARLDTQAKAQSSDLRKA